MPQPVDGRAAPPILSNLTVATILLMRWLLALFPLLVSSQVALAQEIARETLPVLAPQVADSLRLQPMPLDSVRLPARARLSASVVGGGAAGSVGVLQRVTGDTLLFAVPSRQLFVRVPLPEAGGLEVSVGRARGGGHRLAGIGLGALAGAGLGQLVNHQRENDPGAWNGTALGAIVVGAAVGALLGWNSEDDVWRPVPLRP